MRNRVNELGTSNLIGENVTKLRKASKFTQKALMAKMQAEGVNINYSSLSKLEGQTRIATDKEMVAIAKIFNISINDLI